MKFTEIDGLRYEVRCCDDCPFFNDGAGFEYLHTCQHPAWDRKEYMTISEFKTHEMHDKLCPLRDSKPGEGGVIDPIEQESWTLAESRCSSSALWTVRRRL